MARRQKNIFSTSFIDLVFGALGAVILLFIISTQLISEMQSDIDKIEELNVEVNELEDIVEQARNSIPTEIYDQIMEQIEQLKNTISELETEIQELEKRLADCEENSQQQQQQIENLETQVEQLQEQVEDTEGKLKDCEENAEVIEGEARFIVITMGWGADTAPKSDMDLYITDPRGNVFFYKKTKINGVPGVLSLDNKVGTPGLEVWENSNPLPGKYKVEVNYYAGSATNVSIKTWFYFRTGTKQIDNITLIQPDIQNRKLVATFEFNEDGSVNFIN